MTQPCRFDSTQLTPAHIKSHAIPDFDRHNSRHLTSKTHPTRGFKRHKSRQRILKITELQTFPAPFLLDSWFCWRVMTSPTPTIQRDVRSLEDANHWPEHDLAVSLEYLKTLGIGAGRMVDIVGSLSISSAFSGVGGFELAWTLCARSVEAFVDHSSAFTRADALFCIERDADCQRELDMMPHKPLCLFGDMCDAINPSIKGTLQNNAHRMTFEKLEMIFRRPNSVSPSMPCRVHGRACCVRRARVHWCSSPCVNFSRLGKKEGFSGSECLTWFAWVAQRRQLKEPLILHENVEDFPLRALGRPWRAIHRQSKLQLAPHAQVVRPAIRAQATHNDHGAAFDVDRRNARCDERRFLQVRALVPHHMGRLLLRRS